MVGGAVLIAEEEAVHWDHGIAIHASAVAGIWLHLQPQPRGKQRLPARGVRQRRPRGNRRLLAKPAPSERPWRRRGRR